MSLMSPRFAHAPKLDFDRVLKSPTTVKSPQARPQRVVDARVQLSDLGPKHASKGTVSGSLPPSHAADNPQARADGDYTATFANLAQASSRYPCKAWLATQPSSWDSRDHSNVKLVEVNDFNDAIKDLKPQVPLAGLIVWAPLHKGAEETLAHLDALPRGAPIIGITFDLTTAPEGTMLQAGFVGALCAVASRKLPVELDLSIQKSGACVLDELLECLSALETLPDPIAIILPALGRPPIPSLANGNSSANSDSPTAQIDSDAHLRALAQLGLRPNVYLSLAGLTPSSSIEDRALQLALEPALEAFGTDRLLYGSDWPSAAHEEPALSPRGVKGEASKYEARFEAVLAALHELGVGEQEDVDAIFAGNAEKVYRLKL